MSNKQKTEVSEKRYFAIKNISKRCVFFLNKVQDSNEEELVEPSSTKDSREKIERINSDLKTLDLFLCIGETLIQHSTRYTKSKAKKTME